MTFLFDKIVFGPIQSRRLGISLGVNLLAKNHKVCNFDCIYCECGWNEYENTKKYDIPTKEKVKLALEKKLKDMQSNHEKLDVITFAGNGEPTLHRNFDEIINDTISLRDKFFPDAKITVLSNSTSLHKKSVVNALKKIDNNVLKLDGGFQETVQIINQPLKNFKLEDLVQEFLQFEGDLIIQTLFLKGHYKGQKINNTNDEEIKKWLEYLKIIKPKQVMIYTIARDTPAENLEKVSKEKLQEIANKVENLGFKTSISV